MTSFRSGLAIGSLGATLSIFSLGSFSPMPVPKPSNVFLSALTCDMELDTQTDHVKAEVLVVDYEYEDGGRPRCIYSAVITPYQTEKKR
jgi:hypothetical protein